MGPVGGLPGAPQLVAALVLLRLRFLFGVSLVFAVFVLLFLFLFFLPSGLVLAPVRQVPPEQVPVVVAEGEEEVAEVLKVLQPARDLLLGRVDVDYADVSDGGRRVALLCPGVVRQLEVPLAGQALQQARALLQDGVDDVLVSQVRRVQRQKLLFRRRTPQLVPLFPPSNFKSDMLGLPKP